MSMMVALRMRAAVLCPPAALALLLLVAAWSVPDGHVLAQPSSAPAPPANSPASTALRGMDHLKTAGGLPSLPGARWVQKEPEPLSVHFAQQRDAARTDPPYNRGHVVTRETPKGDSGVRFKQGDAIVTGTSGESWPIARATFATTYSPVAGGRIGRDGKFFKKPLPVLGVQMSEPFTVMASWGKLEGKSGDWLIQYDEAGRDFGIVGEAIFEKTYRKLPTTPELQAKLAAMRARTAKP
jgi:hypothetical protein